MAGYDFIYQAGYVYGLQEYHCQLEASTIIKVMLGPILS